MNYDFFLEQLQLCRDQFILEPDILVLSGGVKYPVDTVKWVNYRGNEIVIDFGGSDVNWEVKYDELAVELKEVKDNLSIFEKDLVEKSDEIDELEGSMGSLKEEIAELESEKEDLEITIEELTVNNRALCGNLEEADRRIRELEKIITNLNPEAA